MKEKKLKQTNVSAHLIQYRFRSVKAVRKEWRQSVSSYLRAQFLVSPVYGIYETVQNKDSLCLARNDCPWHSIILQLNSHGFCLGLCILVAYSLSFKSRCENCVFRIPFACWCQPPAAPSLPAAVARIRQSATLVPCNHDGFRLLSVQSHRCHRHRLLDLSSDV